MDQISLRCAITCQLHHLPLSLPGISPKPFKEKLWSGSRLGTPPLAFQQVMKSISQVEQGQKDGSSWSSTWGSHIQAHNEGKVAFTPEPTAALPRETHCRFKLGVARSFLYRSRLSQWRHWAQEERSKESFIHGMTTEASRRGQAFFPGPRQ